jgi:hypothetical protein
MNEWWLKQNFWYVLLWVYIMCSTWHIVSDNCGRLISASKCQSKLYFSAVLTHGTFEKNPSLKPLREPPMQPSRGLQKPLPNLSIDMTPRILFKMLQLSDPTPLPSAGYRRHTNELEDIRMNWGSFFFRNNSFVCLPIHSYVFGTQPSGAHKTCNQF